MNIERKKKGEIKMEKIINGKQYNTRTAKFVGQTSQGIAGGLNYWWEELYKKRTGEFFLQGYGGPMSKYNECEYGHEIRPLSLKEAKKWVEKHLDSEMYKEIFDGVKENKIQRFGKYIIGKVGKFTELFLHFS